MREKILLRPKCENCGERIYRAGKPFRPIIGYSSIPVHCPRCGERLSAKKKEALVKHDRSIWFLLFIVFITLLIVIVVIYLSQQK